MLLFQLKRLRQGFHRFLKVCQYALEVNSEHITSDQVCLARLLLNVIPAFHFKIACCQEAYQMNLEASFQALKGKLDDLLKSAGDRHSQA